MASSALRGSHVLVTGATTPLARVLAVAMAEARGTVSVTTAHAVLAEEVQANSILNETWSAGSQGEARTLDLASSTAVEEMIADIERVLPPVDALVNVVSPDSAEIADASTACRVIGGRMAARGAGRIVNVIPPEIGLEAREEILDLTARIAAQWRANGLAVRTLVIEAGAALDARDAIVALTAGIGDVPADEPLAAHA